MYLKKLSIGRSELGMLALVGGATLLRLLLISFNWPTTNSDEATMGLMGLHIAYKGEHPTFYYGQFYMGPLEAYIAAFVFRAFDIPTLFMFRLGLVFLFALFLICFYAVLCKLYSKRFALACVGLFSLGSIDVILHQLRGIGGYPEIILLGAVILFLVAWLSLSSPTANAPVTVQIQWRRYLVYGLLGGVIGFALWTHQIILPLVATSSLTLLLFCRRELFWRGSLCLFLGFIIGALPLLIYNFTAPAGQTSIDALLYTQRSGADEVRLFPYPLLRQIVGSSLIALPAITGANPLCSTEQMPLFGPWTHQTLVCTAAQGGWSLAFFLLAGVASWQAASFIWKYWRRRRTNAIQEDMTVDERQQCILQFNHLMLLLSAFLTLLAFTFSPAAALYPAPTSRYLICMQLAIPAVLWPLWKGIGRQAGDRQVFRRVRVFPLLRVMALLFVLTVFVMGTIGVFADAPRAQEGYRQTEALILQLQKMKIKHIYSDYWTCNRLIFQSSERIICAVLNVNLGPGKNRYRLYRDIVKADPQASYIFPQDAVQVQAFEQRMATQKKLHYRRFLFEGYIIYTPLGKANMT
jgi:hypothetical protein